MTFLKHVSASLLIASFLFVPVSQHFELKRAEAQWAVFDAANVVQNTMTALSTYSLEVKEYILDGSLAWLVINKVLEDIVDSTTKWVNNGFKNPYDPSKSGPAFISNFEDFIKDSADVAFGEFLIEGGPLEFLCSPFKFQINQVLQFQYSGTGRGYKPVCTFTEAVGNLEGFLSGDFYDGGFDGFAKMALNPYGNALGSTFAAQAELGASIVSATGRDIEIAGWGAGFKTQQECDEEEKREGSGRLFCWTTTPGNVIETGLNNTLNLGNERLTIGDEIDELVAALLTQLMGSILGDGGSLSGYRPPADNSYDPIQAAALAETDALREQMAEERNNANSGNDSGSPIIPPGDSGDWCFVGGDPIDPSLFCYADSSDCDSASDGAMCFQLP